MRRDLEPMLKALAASLLFTLAFIVFCVYHIAKTL
jgi:hypothetical protein